MLARILLIAVSGAAAAAWPGDGSATDADAYSITGHVPGSGGAWDYAVVDAHSGRLFLAQGGVTAMDLETNKVTAGLVAGKITHGLVPLGDGTVAVDDSKTKVITIFDAASGKLLSTISTANDNRFDGIHALDSMLLEPKTGLLIALNGESGLLLLIDVKKASVVGTLSVDGHPEFAAADGMGNIYINV